MSNEKEKKKEKIETSKAKPVKPVETPFEKATKVAEAKLLKLYNKMPNKVDTMYTGPEIATAIGLDPESSVDVRALSLVWHRLFDEGKVATPQFIRPPKVTSAKKPPLPVM